MSYNVCKGWDLSSFSGVTVQISNNNDSVNINVKSIYTRSKSVNKNTVKHRRRPVGADKRPFAVTYRVSIMMLST